MAETNEKPLEGFVVAGVALNETEAKITVRGVPDQPGMAGFIFSKLAGKNINVDMIIQSSPQYGKNTISFTIEEKDLPEVMRTMDNIKLTVPLEEVNYDPDMAKVSIVGAGMQSHPGVAAKMFSALGSAGINIEMISTSEIKISCALKRKDGTNAVRTIHKAFELHEENMREGGQN